MNAPKDAQPKHSAHSDSVALLRSIGRLLKKYGGPLSLHDIHLLINHPKPRPSYTVLERTMLLSDFYLRGLLPIKEMTSRSIFTIDTARRYTLAEDIPDFYSTVWRSPIEIEFEIFLKERYELPVHSSYSPPGSRYTFDMALIKPTGEKLDIEVDGEKFHYDDEGQLLEKDRIRDEFSKSQGWEVKRFRYRELAENMDTCAQEVEQWWKQ